MHWETQTIAIGKLFVQILMYLGNMDMNNTIQLPINICTESCWSLNGT